MLANLYYLFGNTEPFDNLTGSGIGIVLFLIGLITTLITYFIFVLDTSLDKDPKRKSNRLRTTIIAGILISLIISFFIGNSINRHNFCKANPDICLADYSFSFWA